MAITLVVLQEPDRLSTRDGVTQLILSASSIDDALAASAARFTGPPSNAAWKNAFAFNTIDFPEVADPGALVGWIFQVKILDSDPVIEVEVVGDSTNDTLDDIGVALAVALNEDPQIANASYNPATNALIVAQGATDALGDKRMQVNVFPPRLFDTGGNRKTDDVNIPDFVTSITDQGVSGDDLVVQYTADTHLVPIVLVSGIAVDL